VVFTNDKHYATELKNIEYIPERNSFMIEENEYLSDCIRHISTPKVLNSKEVLEYTFPQFEDYLTKRNEKLQWSSLPYKRYYFSLNEEKRLEADKREKIRWIKRKFGFNRFID